MCTLSIAKHCLYVATALTISGCASNPWHNGLTENDCDPVVYELDGFGKTRGEALSDAANSAMAQEFGAYLTSEMVLEGGKLAVNRQGQATRGTLDSAIAIREQTRESDGSVRLLTRVTLCKSSIRPDARTGQPELNADGDMLERTQARVDLSRSQSSAHMQKTQDFNRAFAALLNPATGPQLHQARVIRNDSTDVSSPPRRNRQTRAGMNEALRESVVFEVTVGIDLDPQVRKALEQQLDNIAVGYHSSSRFVNTFKQLNQNPGLAIIDKRFEHLANNALHPSDRQYVSLKAHSGRPTDDVVNVTILKGIIKTTQEDAIYINKQVGTAVEAFYKNGLSLIGLSKDSRTVLEVPLFEGVNSSVAQVRRIALYPETHEGAIHRANGAVFDAPDRNEQKWLSRRASPLTMLYAQRGSTQKYPALSRGGNRLEIRLSVPSDLATQISHFKVRPTHPTGNIFYSGLQR